MLKNPLKTVRNISLLGSVTKHIASSTSSK